MYVSISAKKMSHVLAYGDKLCLIILSSKEWPVPHYRTLLTCSRLEGPILYWVQKRFGDAHGNVNVAAETMGYGRMKPGAC